MPDYSIREVATRRELRMFINFPDRLYRDCPQYVPALHADQRKSLTRVSTLSYCSRKMWLVMDGREVVGRICAMINPRYNELYSRKCVRFGWFDTINDIEGVVACADRCGTTDTDLGICTRLCVGDVDGNAGELTLESLLCTSHRAVVDSFAVH